MTQPEPPLPHPEPVDRPAYQPPQPPAAPGYGAGGYAGQQPGWQPGRPPGQPPGFQPGQQPQWGAPPNAMSPSDERLWSLLAHLSWIAGSVVAIAPLGPLVVWLFCKDRSPMVRHHALEALNLWITVYLVGAVCFATFWLLFPIFVIGFVALAAAVLSVVAAVAANRGEAFGYPAILRLVR